MTRCLTICLLAAPLALLTPLAPARPAAAATLSVSPAAPPTELAEPIRVALDAKAVRLADGDKPFFEFWFRKGLTLATTPATDAPLAGLAEGTLLGALRVNEERYDFKDEEIPPGVYLMRFGLQPEDGNHLGVSPTRTFVLLIPAADDQDLEAFSGHDSVVEASSKVNAAEHPSNLNLQPLEEATGEFPRLAEHSDGDHKVLCVVLPAKTADGKPSELKFALVYEGTGQL
jgi:hypothetical protein